MYMTNNMAAGQSSSNIASSGRCTNYNYIEEVTSSAASSLSKSSFVSNTPLNLTILLNATLDNLQINALQETEILKSRNQKIIINGNTDNNLYTYNVRQCFSNCIKSHLYNLNLNIEYLSSDRYSLTHIVSNYLTESEFFYYFKIKYTIPIDIFEHVKFKCVNLPKCIIFDNINYKEKPYILCFAKIAIIHNFNESPVKVIIQPYTTDDNNIDVIINLREFIINAHEYLVIDKCNLDKFVIIIYDSFENNVIKSPDTIGLYLTNSSIDEIILHRNDNISYTVYCYKHLFWPLIDLVYKKIDSCFENTDCNNQLNVNQNFTSSIVIDNFFNQSNYLRFFGHVLFLYHLSFHNQYKIELIDDGCNNFKVIIKA
ncbi:MAG: hypothetical protein [Cotesia congregata filamentous virus 2]